MYPISIVYILQAQESITVVEHPEVLLGEVGEVDFQEQITLDNCPFKDIRAQASNDVLLASLPPSTSSFSTFHENDDILNESGTIKTISTKNKRVHTNTHTNRKSLKKSHDPQIFNVINSLTETVKETLNNNSSSNHQAHQ